MADKDVKNTVASNDDSKPKAAAVAGSVGTKKPDALARKKTATTKSVKTKSKSKVTKTVKASPAKPENKKLKQIMTPKEDIMTTAKTQMEKMMHEATNANKESWDSFMKAGNTFMKGMEEMMKVSMTQAQKTAEKNSQNVKKLMACKTVNEFTEMQTRTAQENFDEMMSGMTKLSELSVKVAGECFAPVNDQINKTVKKASETMAA